MMNRGTATRRLCYRAVADIGIAKGKSSRILVPLHRILINRLADTWCATTPSTELYMLPFSPLVRPFFTDKELQAWAEVMMEKGLRIRRPFEHYWHPMADAPKEHVEQGDPMREEDQVFDFLQERKRLMPY